MASLPSEHLTAAHVQRLLDTPVDPRMFIGLRDIMDHARKNPTPTYVRYEATFSWFAYVRPRDFYWRSTKSPSDCDWIVPGTLKDTSNL